MIRALDLVRRLPPVLVVLGALAVPTVAQVDDGTTVETAILDILLERGLIGQDEYEELLGLARDRADSAWHELDRIENRLERLRAPEVSVEGGRPGKLTFRSPDGKWSTTVKGRVQARAADFDHSSNAKDGKNFSVARGRVGFSGNAGHEDLTYKLEIDASTNKSLFDSTKGTTLTDSAGDTVFIPATNSSKTMTVEDAWINWLFSGNANLRMGQLKVPFGREEATSSSRISFMERSAASRTFAPGKEPGAMLHGGNPTGTFEYFLAVTNGEGKGAANVQGQNMDGLRSGARVVFNPLGPVKLDGPAFQTIDSGETKVGIGLSVMKLADGAAKNSAAPMTDTQTIGGDVHVFSGPWSFLAEVFTRDESAPGLADVDDRGSTVQVGVFVEPKVWELVARSSTVDFDKTNGRRWKEHALGVNRYVDGHDGKWMFDFVRHRNFAGSTSNAKEVRVQYQSIF